MCPKLENDDTGELPPMPGLHQAYIDKVSSIAPIERFSEVAKLIRVEHEERIDGHRHHGNHSDGVVVHIPVLLSVDINGVTITQSVPGGKGSSAIDVIAVHPYSEIFRWGFDNNDFYFELTPRETVVEEKHAGLLDRMFSRDAHTTQNQTVELITAHANVFNDLIGAFVNGHVVVVGPSTVACTAAAVVQAIVRGRRARAAFRRRFLEHEAKSAEVLSLTLGKQFGTLRQAFRTNRASSRRKQLDEMKSAILIQRAWR